LKRNIKKLEEFEHYLAKRTLVEEVVQVKNKENKKPDLQTSEAK